MWFFRKKQKKEKEPSFPSIPQKSRQSYARNIHRLNLCRAKLNELAKKGLQDSKEFTSWSHEYKRRTLIQKIYEIEEAN